MLMGFMSTRSIEDIWAALLSLIWTRPAFLTASHFLIIPFSYYTLIFEYKSILNYKLFQILY